MSEPTSESKTGGCLCGAVRFRVSGPLRGVVACHCTQCRKTSGHHVAATQARADDVAVEETALRWFRSSPTAERGFCATCGSNLFWRRFGDPRLSIMAGALDTPTGLRLERQIHTESASDYYPLPPVPVVCQDDLG